MGFVAILIMLLGGVSVAALVIGAMAIQRAAEERAPATEVRSRDAIAASILAHVLCAGGTTREEAARRVRRDAGLPASPTFGIDLSNWAASFAGSASASQRMELLESCVRLVAKEGRVIPLRQYAALLDLSFALGFQTDALARLREIYGFDYVDHAKSSRPRSADRSGGGAPLFQRSARNTSELCEILEVAQDASVQQIVVAYRRLAAKHHPDRFHDSSSEDESAAAARFIEITRAYEELVSLRRGQEFPPS